MTLAEMHRSSRRFAKEAHLLTMTQRKIQYLWYCFRPLARVSFYAALPRSRNCCAAVNACPRIRPVLIRQVKPEAANIMAITTN